MTQETRIYRTFPPEVVSNSHDFDVRWVVHNDQRMRGVFARRTVPAPDCSLFMGAYPGHRVSKEENTCKVARYEKEHGVDRLIAIRQTVAYSLSLRNHDPGYVLDPTDEQGKLLPEFIPYLVCYINEPPPGCPSKAAFVYNQPRQRYEVWLLQAVQQDEEVYLYYGKHYARDYPVNAGSSDGQFAHFIPADSTLKPDMRGVPAPLQVPIDLKNSMKQESSEKER
jgi:hypothetical protein